MVPDVVIQNARIINEYEQFTGSVLIFDGMITEIRKGKQAKPIPSRIETIDASELVLFPGIIDDQVHFREPGLTHKADIYSESKASVAGGITSFMEMPNTKPQTITQELLQAKFDMASKKSFTNYSFYIGATNDNIDEIVKTDPRNVCGIKVFMGSSTGNMLVDNPESLAVIFRETNLPVAVHCEDENTIQQNQKHYKEKFGAALPFSYHPEIRSAEACYKSSSLAVELAKKYNTRLHILHLSTQKELDLLDNSLPLEQKRITGEVCIHHLWFNKDDYETKGALIKWNPAVKSENDRQSLLEALNNNTLDVIATDHAPHTLDEKSNSYFKAPSGGPLVQHALPAVLEFYHNNTFTLEKIAEKMCHAPARLFQINKRGFIREGYHADLVLVDLNKPWKVEKNNILYKCNWSPFEGTVFQSKIVSTIINGNVVYKNGIFEENIGQALKFNRK